MSRVGKLPVAIPADVKVSVADNLVTVEGPKGKLVQNFNNLVNICVESDKVVVTRVNDEKATRAAHGLYRRLIHNMIVGVTSGYSKTLLVIGVGYKAEVKGNQLVLDLGFSNDFIATIPDGLNVKVDDQNKITISGIDKQFVGEFAAEIRKLRAPEPYKGKGVRYDNEIVRKKVGKSGVK